MRLGERRFEVVVEAMDGEEVVWEGGPSPNATWLRALRWLLVTAWILAIPLAAFTMAALSSNEPSSRRQGAGAQPTPQLTPAEQQARRERIEANRQKALQRLLGGSALGLVVLGGIYLVASHQRTRNAWYIVTTERVCIQSGGGQRTLLVVDLDKILSVQASSFWLDRRCGLHHVELVIGGTPPQKVPSWAKSEHNAFAYVPVAENLLSKLTNDWLPRDNRR